MYVFFYHRITFVHIVFHCTRLNPTIYWRPTKKKKLLCLLANNNFMLDVDFVFISAMSIDVDNFYYEPPVIASNIEILFTLHKNYSEYFAE